MTDAVPNTKPASERIGDWFRNLLGFFGQGRQHRAATGAKARIKLRYFEDVLPVEFDAINKRRVAVNKQRLGEQRGPVQPTKSGDPADRKEKLTALPPTSRPPLLSPDPEKLFPPDNNALKAAGPPPPADPVKPTYYKTRPKPVPNDAVGLAFSGGGIRSAAVCLGALQSLYRTQRIDRVDYLSTVSGGGYMGACLSATIQAAQANQAGQTNQSPFGADISDSPAVAHLRNYSNYLLPRGHSGLRNIAEAAAVILRGLLANLVIVGSTVLFLVLVTKLAYPDAGSLRHGSFVPNLLEALTGDYLPLNAHLGSAAFVLSRWMLGITIALLVLWAMLRSSVRLDVFTGDNGRGFLVASRWMMIATLIVAFLDLQAELIENLSFLKSQPGIVSGWHTWIAGIFAAYSGTISVLGGFLGHFLQTSRQSRNWTTLALRIVTHLAIFLAALVLPLLIWLAYLFLCEEVIVHPVPPALPITQATGWFGTIIGWVGAIFDGWSKTGIYSLAFFCLWIIALLLSANSYSLHRFYRDRLSKAFLFGPQAAGQSEPPALDGLKLSSLKGSLGPYHIINTAMNVQGSAEANKRGRNADFFMFTRDFIGSDLTLYGPVKENAVETTDMENLEPRLDLATAMAISGAAVSANMGTNTIRLMSPTLALLNIRLGYWLRNPRDLAKEGGFWRGLADITSRLYEKFFLLWEMLNQIDERSRNVFLSDGGHIENLGVYELLKRGCGLIVVIDAEADPEMTFAAFLKLERYARIDLGVRISLPWQDIAARSKALGDSMEAGDPPGSGGPHCAIGRICYENRAPGTLVYFKSSLTGDEKDYILDYKKRNPSFPHESTGDQFFSEEQFEVYRALGFHMVDSFFTRESDFSHHSTGEGAFSSKDAAFATVNTMMSEQVPT